MESINSTFGALVFLLAGVFFLFVSPYKSYKDITNHPQAKEYGLKTGTVYIAMMFATMLCFVCLNLFGVLTATSKASYALWIFSILLMSGGMIMMTVISFLYLIYNTIHVYTLKKKKISIVVAVFLMCLVSTQIIMPMFVNTHIYIKNELTTGTIRQPMELFRLFVMNVPNPFVTDSATNQYGLGFVMIAIVTYIIMAFVLMPKETKNVFVSWFSGKNPETI